AALIDLRTTRSASVNLTTKFPPRRVEDSDSVKISIVGDILGPAITNLDKLLGKFQDPKLFTWNQNDFDWDFSFLILRAADRMRRAKYGPFCSGHHNFGVS